MTRRTKAPESITGPLPNCWKGRHIVITNWKDSRHPEAGGAELYCEAIAAVMACEGVRVTYVTSRPPGTAAYEERDFGTVVRRGGRFGTYLWALMWLARHRNDIDAVIDSEAGIPYFSPLVVRRRTPVALVIHHVHQEQFDEYFPKPLSTLGKVAERRGTDLVYGRRRVCAVSPTTRDDIRCRLGLRGPVFIAPNALASSAPPTRLDSTPVRTGRSAHPTIVTVGRLVHHKRYHLLLAALPAVLAHHPDLLVHLIGDGDAMNDLRSQAHSLGLDAAVTFHGRLPASERDALLEEAWLTATTSAREGWGVSVMEAAAAGVPSVAFAVPGLSDSIRDGETGRLVGASADFSTIVADMVEELRDPGAALKWATHCRAWAESFSWDATTLNILSILEAARADPPGRRERRSVIDTASVLTLDATNPRGPAMDPQRASRLRATDQARRRKETVEVLLPGCDQGDAVSVADRLGAQRASARLASSQDLLGWGPLRTACGGPRASWRER